MKLIDEDVSAWNAQWVNPKELQKQLILLSKRITKVNKRLDQAESRIEKLEKIPSPPIVVKEAEGNPV